MRDIILMLHVCLWEGGKLLYTPRYELQEQRKWFEVTNDALPLGDDFLLENAVEMPIN